MARSTAKPMLWMLAAMMGLALSLPAAAQWKWRDKSGQIQYSDRPPPAGTPPQDILQKPNAVARREAAAAAAVPASAASGLPTAKTTDPELEAKRRKAEEEAEAAKKKPPEDEKTAAARAENCARAKSYLRTLDEGMRVARTNAKGEREVLDDKGRAEEATRTRGVIATDCK